MADLLYLIPLLPLVAFVINIFWGRSTIRGNAHWIAIPAAFGAWVLSILVFRDVYSNETPLTQRLFTWIPAGEFDITVSLYVDQLTAVMLLVVTSIGLLVNIYSVGYMHGEDGYYRFFSYIPLFIFSMLMLVMADNLLTLFIFWEAVGLCSYFLIGYYFNRRSANNAAKKAFIVNRVGDLAFGVGIMLTFWEFGTIYLHGDNGIIQMAMNHADYGISAGVLTAIGVLLFLGACGKSAQFPLHVWLPDAMEGPTPVSALIHAATMVTAGIYMVARTYTIFMGSETAMLFVAVIGSITAFMGASIALTQHDIKKVVAYSTVSQLGFMAFALGTGVWVAAIFHLMTHAFFKGLLFLGSGSVIHGMGGEQDMRKMGGLRKHMPVTFWTFLIGAAANAGIVPLAGFWSKDEIIVGAWLSDSSFGKMAAILGLITAFLTALYMFRLVFIVFFGEENFGKEVHPHESGPWMAVPLVILAVASVFVGFVGFPPEDGAIHHFLHLTFDHAIVHHPSTAMLYAFAIISTVVAVGGIVAAYMVYMRKAVSTDALAAKYSGVYKFLLNKWYIDEFFMAAVVNPLKDIAMFLWKIVDVRIIDGTVNGIGTSIVASSQRLRKLQTGMVGTYATQIAIGMVVLLGVFLLAFGNLF